MRRYEHGLARSKVRSKLRGDVDSRRTNDKRSSQSSDGDFDIDAFGEHSRPCCRDCSPGFGPGCRISLWFFRLRSAFVALHRFIQYATAQISLSSVFGENEDNLARLQ